MFQKIIYSACRHTVVAALIAAPYALAEPADREPGVEVEHSPGAYSTLWGSIDGWELWSIELESGRVCDALKAQDGKTLPAPAYDGIFANADPHVMILGNEALPFKLSQIQSPDKADLAKEFRLKGERFFTEYHYKNTHWADFDGQEVEFHIAGRRRSGETFDTTFTIDMTGSAAASAWVDACLTKPAAP
jgi:hypothetical protein